LDLRFPSSDQAKKFIHNCPSLNLVYFCREISTLVVYLFGGEKNPNPSV
jgi:hypothetical protein